MTFVFLFNNNEVPTLNLFSLFKKKTTLMFSKFVNNENLNHGMA